MHSGRRRTQQRRESKRQDDVSGCEKIKNSNDWDELSINEMINDAVEFEEVSEDGRYDVEGISPDDMSAIHEPDVIDLTSPDREIRRQSNKSDIDCFNKQNIIAQEDEQEDVNVEQSGVDDDACMSECDDFRRRKGMKRRLHIVCE